MNNPASEKVSREKLFALVWEKPATQVARDLGISDVALGKLCRRLQVPKPPRGYWERVRAGTAPKRPNLEAFREELDSLRKAPPKDLIQLSQKQQEYFRRALEELAAAGTDTTDCSISYRGIHSIGPELAARIILLVQNRYAQWIGRDAPHSVQRGAEQSIGNLVKKLLPRARPQVVIFHHEEPSWSKRDFYPATVVRLSATLQRKIAYLYKLTKEAELSYVALSLRTLEHAQFIRYLGPPDSHEPVEAEICISSQAVWVEGRIRHPWDDRDYKLEFKSEKIPVNQLIPADLLPGEDVRLPANIRPAWIKPYRRRLEALKQAYQVMHELLEASSEAERAVPDDKIAVMDRLLFGKDHEGPLSAVRQAWRKFDQELDHWECVLEAEEAAICEEVLGIRVGDDVIAESEKKVKRIHVKQARVLVDESGVMFHIYGTRYRKDGTPGKREEGFILRVENQKK